MKQSTALELAIVRAAYKHMRVSATSEEDLFGKFESYLLDNPNRCLLRAVLQNFMENANRSLAREEEPQSVKDERKRIQAEVTAKLVKALDAKIEERARELLNKRKKKGTAKARRR